MMASVVKELFTNRYWINVEERAFFSDEWIEQIGVMGVTSMEEAEVVLSRFRQVKITIPVLAEYYRAGYRLQFINQADVPTIFNILDTHLDNWTKLTNQLGYINPIPPIEDFELLDSLAELLFPYRQLGSSMHGIFKLLNNTISPANNLSHSTGMYKPYAPGLFKYCQQVWG